MSYVVGMIYKTYAEFLHLFNSSYFASKDGMPAQLKSGKTVMHDAAQ